jgi:S-formylglutathione hydrolase FrmB
MKKISIILIFCLEIIGKQVSAKVDTVSIYSNSMHKFIKAVVITPSNYNKKKLRFPVVYLLHGYGGDYSNWIKKVPALQSMSNEDQLMIVCPDGGFSSWYFDSPIDSNYKYETYVALEVPQYIDAHYKTIANRNARAITGLSMGGHGGLFLGFRYADMFGACGSMSGGVDMRPFPRNWDIAKRIGDSLHYANNWKDYSVISIVEHQLKDSLAIIIDCGVDDFFYPVNKNLHNKLLQLKIPHDYIERPGKHSWDYWANAVQYQLLFFRKYFYKK